MLENLTTIQYITLMVVLVLLFSRLIPEFIDCYRNLKVSNRKKPYAYFEIKSSNFDYGLTNFTCNIDFTRCCNKAGMFCFIRELDRTLKEEEGTDLVELVQEVRKAEEVGEIADVKSADEDS